MYMRIAVVGVLKEQDRRFTARRQFSYRSCLRASGDLNVVTGLCASVSDVNIIGLIYLMIWGSFLWAQATGIPWGILRFSLPSHASVGCSAESSKICLLNVCNHFLLFKSVPRVGTVGVFKTARESVATAQGVIMKKSVVDKGKMKWVFSMNLCLTWSGLSFHKNMGTLERSAGKCKNSSCDCWQLCISVCLLVVVSWD